MVICKRERSPHYTGGAIFMIKLPLYFLNVTNALLIWLTYSYFQLERYRTHAVFQN